nr:MamI family restriction endonuclease [Dietzia maris]
MRPRLELIKWSRITKQTPNIKIGYPGQHLSSLVTGVEGSRTGARGHDLMDGSEVKSCSRIDQLDKCKECKGAVARLENECPECGSTNIKRNNDSKWLFSIRTESELELLTRRVERVLLMIGDHPNFDQGDYSTLRFQAFEIWPGHERHRHFVTLMENYYHNLYLGHKAKNAAATPAPKNFWPYSFQYYMCNPIKTFSCTVVNSDTAPVATVDYFLDPKADREPLASELMPGALLNTTELNQLLKLGDAELDQFLTDDVSPQKFRAMPDGKRKKSLAPLDERARSRFTLRDTDVPTPHSSPYSRSTVS